MVTADGETGRGQDKQTVFYVASIWKKRNELPNVEAPRLGLRTALSLERYA